MIVYRNNVSRFQAIKRTYCALMQCYPNQKIDKETVLRLLDDKEFQSKYVDY